MTEVYQSHLKQATEECNKDTLPLTLVPRKNWADLTDSGEGNGDHIICHRSFPDAHIHQSTLHISGFLPLGLVIVGITGSVHRWLWSLRTAMETRATLPWDVDLEACCCSCLVAVWEYKQIYAANK